MRTILTAVLLTSVLSCSGEKPASPPAPAASVNAVPQGLEELPSPAAGGSAQPFLFATREGVGLSWLEPVAGTDRVALRFALHRSGAWEPARTVTERNDLFVNWADFPSMVEDAKGALYAHWLQKSGKGTYAYDIRMTTSNDGGTTWREPFVLHRDGTETEHGFVSLAALPVGGIAAAWLDGRKMSAGAGDHEGHDGGDMTLRYATVSADGSLAGEVELDSRTCECCTTGMAVTAAGPLIAYRDRDAVETRDIAWVRRDGAGWTTPKLARNDGWKINGCPVNGPQVDALGQGAVIAWFSGAEEKPSVYVAFSQDGASTFGAAVRVDEGKPAGRVDVVLLDSQTALVTWLEQTTAGAETRARRVSANDGTSPSIRIAESDAARTTGFTRIVRTGDHVWFAWTAREGETKQIRLARLRP
jgi:hypothetical protein